MYSSLEDTKKVDEEYRAAGYEVEDWANNDLGTARGWWTKTSNTQVEDDEAEEKRGALREALSRRTAGNKVAPGLAQQRQLEGALRRALTGDNPERVLDVLCALDRIEIDAASLSATSLARLVGKQRRSSNTDVAHRAKALTTKWKRCLANNNPGAAPLLRASPPAAATAKEPECALSIGGAQSSSHDYK